MKKNEKMKIQNGTGLVDRTHIFVDSHRSFIRIQNGTGLVERTHAFVDSHRSFIRSGRFNFCFKNVTAFMNCCDVFSHEIFKKFKRLL